jgi:coenzyme F420-dependent glucose-6-phosphate dehydrogenase
MAQLVWHASHEELPPAELLELAVLAERAGFDGVHSSDHLAPWFPDGESGHAWAWLGAAMARTQVPFGVVTAPGQRYHPVVHAQAIGTLASMFPGRLTVSLGSGEATNEHVTGDPWPPKAARNERLGRCARLIRALLAGETVDCDDPVVHRGRLYSLPSAPPRLFAAAMTAETAAEVAGWADGLITVGSDPDAVRQVTETFRRNGGADKPVHLQVHVSWATDDEAARRQAVERWPINALPPEVTQDLETPEEVARAVADVDPARVLDSLVASADPGRHADHLGRLCDIGLERLVVHQVGVDQRGFIDFYAREVLPRLR